jgi:hypothetical protein
MRTNIVWLALFMAVPWSMAAQRAALPPANQFYRTDVVPRIDIAIPADSLAAILTNVTSDYEYHATFAFTAPGFSVSGVEVGFRLRGNTSRSSGKKSFKISFNSFTPGARSQGVKDLNLNGEHNDPSIMRARIAWELAQDLGIPAPRVNHVRLFINGQPFGLYANVEHFNDDYVEHRFARDAGNLYKCLYPADLANLGTDPASYKLSSGGRRVYELETNEGADDYRGLAAFVTALHATTGTQSLCALDSIFNVNDYLKWLAWEITTGHWDNHSFNKNNFYLYEDPASGLMHFSSYDADNTFGVDWFNINWATRGITQFGTYPLYTKISANPEAQRRLGLFLNELGALAGTSAWQARNTNLRAQLAPYVEEDAYRSLDYGYDSLDFWNALTVAAGAHVKFGIHPFMATRIASSAIQIPQGNVEPIVFPPRIVGHGASGRVPIQVEVWDEAIPSVVLHYQPTGGSWQSLTLLDDGAHHDELAGDRLYGALLDGVSNGFSYYVTATDAQGAANSAPCSPGFWATIAGPNVVLNEVCSANANGPTAPNGNREDWIELLNPGATSVSLNGLYLSDSRTNPAKASLNGYSIPAGGRLLLWASGSSSFTGALPFKLDANGEGVYLSRQIAGDWAVLDEVRVPPLMDNQSFGRRHDGAYTWTVFDQYASPNTANSGSLALPESASVVRVLGYPNPFITTFTLRNPTSQALYFEVFNSMGQRLGSLTLPPDGEASWVDDGPSGMRIFQAEGHVLKAFKRD